MSDPDLREFFKSPNKAKNYNKKMKKDFEQRKTHFDPIVPFAKPVPSQTWKEPKPPIDVVKNGSYDEWEWMGVTFRPYYAGNLWLNCDASYVYFAFHDHDTNTVTTVRRLEVKLDAEGKQYIENYINKVLTKVYLDDALRTVYHTGLPPVQSQVSQIHTQSTLCYCEKKDTTIFNHDGYEYSFYHDGKFCVSRAGGLACWMHIDWNGKPPTFDKVIPYNIKTKANGRKYVDVKQPDGTYKEFDIATAVCKTFYKEPITPGLVVKFKDGNEGNCDADNLYWGMP